MAVVTLQQLIDRARQRADQVTGTFVTDAEVTNLINVYKHELDDLLVKAYGAEYFANSTTFSATASTENYSLSALTSGTFYKLTGLDVADSSSPTGYRDVKPYNFHDRNNLRSPNWPGPYVTSTPDLRYRVIGSNLSLRPAPSSTLTMKLYWTPQQTALSSTTDSFDDIAGWSEYIVVSSAIAIKDKAEEDTSVLQNDRNRLVQRITEMAPNRDAAEPMTVADVTGGLSDWPWRL